MQKENNYRRGIDDRLMTQAEFERVKAGGSLYERVMAPENPKNGLQQKKKQIAV